MNEFSKNREQGIKHLENLDSSVLYANIFYSLQHLYKLKESGRFTEEEWYAVKNSIHRLENLLK